MNFGFNCTENSYVVVVDELTGMDPFAPIVVGVNAAGVLEGDAEGSWKFFGVERGEVIAPGGCGIGYRRLWGSGVSGGVVQQPLARPRGPDPRPRPKTYGGL